MLAEGARLQSVVHEEAEAFRQAESALEEAERRLAASIVKPWQANMAAPPPPLVAPVPPNTLSARGLEALHALEAHVNGLTSGDNMARMEQEYQQLQAAAAGRPVQSLLAFVMDRLQREGARQIQVVGFELSKEPAPMVAEASPAAAELAVPMCSMGASAVVAPAGPLAPDQLGEALAAHEQPHGVQAASRAPLKPVKAPVLAMKPTAGRSQHHSAVPTRDPLWVAMHTAAASAGAVVAPANAEDAMTMGRDV